MNRWIDGNWLLNFFEPYPDDYQTPLGTLRACVDDAPLLDLVRCAECKHSDWYKGINGEWRCYCTEHGSSGHKADDFCSYGCRKENER